MENEIFDQIKRELTAYGESMGEVGRLRLIGIISHVLGLFLLIFTIVLCVFAILSFGAVAVIHALSACMPIWAASLIIGSLYIVLIVVAVACRKTLFIHPFIQLLSKDIRTEEELSIRTIEAEHKAELQQVKMSCQVENATRELEFYTNLLGRAWKFIKGLVNKH